jgi:hypothetical protein
MCCGDIDGPQGPGIEPAVSMADAARVEHTDVAVNDGQLEDAIEWRCCDLAPFCGACEARQE